MGLRDRLCAKSAKSGPEFDLDLDPDVSSELATLDVSEESREALSMSMISVYLTIVRDSGFRR